jgi:glucose-6-phosphate isomerase
MNISYFDDARVTDTLLKKKEKALFDYRHHVAHAAEHSDYTVPEASLYYAKDAELHETIASLKKQFKAVKQVVLIGIGGSSLGTEAIHALLNTGNVKLSVLDTVSASALSELRSELAGRKKVTDVALCVISKSGNTTETMANATIVMDDLKQKFGDDAYRQTIFIGNPGTDFMKMGKKLKVTCVAMPEVIGGRYSVATAVGLVPMTLLGHDVDEFISGYLDALHPTLEAVVADSAARLAVYHQLKYPHYTFFAFETRLEKLARWYRQLFAESLGKATDKEGREVKHVIMPTIATPVELHSVGQLLMSGVPDIYTDFVSFDDEELDVMIPKSAKLAPALKGYSVQEVATALYGGVIAAYQEEHLPYRATVFEENLAYSVGQFMSMRLREVMYVAYLLNLNAFDQPNVELYKKKTKEILSL